MSKKSAKIQKLIELHQGKTHNAHYLGYFDCFNSGLFYEAHDVLEELWLPIRREPRGDFYKGLIQLAGAFVHLQKNRLRPAAALFKLAQANLRKFPAAHEDISTTEVLALTETWLGRLEAVDFGENPLLTGKAPRLELPA